MNKVLKYFSIFGVLLLTACGGGGSGSTTPTTPVIPPSTNFSLPTKISPVATTTTPATGKVGLQSKLFALRSALTDPETDYSKAEKVTYVDEHALDQFNIIGQVLNALAQTHYNDDAVSGKGPYRAMVAFQDEEAGIKRKTLQPWTVDSSIIEDDGTIPRHRLVKAWIEEENNLIEMGFKIFAPAIKNPDGSYKSFGTWKMNVKLDASGTANFVAEATLGTNGESIIKIHETFDDGTGQFRQVRAVLHKTDTGGFGQLFYPNWDICLTPNCPPATPTVKYAYDTNHIAVKVDNQPTQFKDRNSVVEMVHRYGLYDSLTGADISKENDFGFPVTYTDTNSNTRHAFYGAWQGRHELWSEAGAVPKDTIVTRADLPAGQTQTYKVAAPIKGTLTKRTKELASVNDLKGIPVETWTNEQFLYIYNGTAWVDCVDPDLTGVTPTCDISSPTLNPGDLLHLEMLPNDYRIFVDIFQETGGTSTQYVYLVGGPDGAGFYALDINGNPSPTKYTPALNDELWININGSIFIEVDPNSGTGWDQKTVTSFDQRNNQPIFADPASNPGDKAWSPIRNREYYLNNNGSKFILKRRVDPVQGELDEVWVEIQTVANPSNAVTLTTGMTFAPQFNEFDLTNPSSYKFDTVPSSPTYLQLVYEFVAEEDKSLGVVQGDLVTQSLWGLGAYTGPPFAVGAVSVGQFNWEYPRDGETWGTATYLRNDDLTMDYVTLSDPIKLNPIVLTTRGGEQRTLSLQYDGWMHGLPDLFDDLQRNNFVLAPLLSNKIISIPEITPLTNPITGRGYRVKQLEVSQFLNAVSDPGTLDISLAAGIDLNNLPPFIAPNLGAIPTVTGVKYSEGILVQ